jgi:hypothetical protein
MTAVGFPDAMPRHIPAIPAGFGKGIIVFSTSNTGCR